MVNSHSELLWHEIKSQGKEVSCESRVFNLFLLKHPTIFTSRGRPRKIPCLPNPDYLAAANNNNTCETERARCPHAAVGLRLSATAVTGWSSALNRWFIAAIRWRQWNDSKTLNESYHRCAVLCMSSRFLCCGCTISRFKEMQGCGKDSLRAWLRLCKAGSSPGNMR